MLFKSAFLLLPLLAKAAPAGLTFQNAEMDYPQVFESVDTADVSLDLEELRLVQFAADQPPIWMSELEKLNAKAAGKKFMDITDTPTLGFTGYFLPSATTAKYTYPSPGNHTKYIKKLYKSLDIDHMKEVLTKFSSFRTRYYRSETGKQSQKWLLSQILEIASKHKGMSVQEFPHAWGQNSIIVRFPSAKKASKDEGPVTILGAHQDSTNSWPFLPAPGADDDGSGTTTSLEALRALADANFTPNDPVEFHYFSAEEGGLLGSQAVAKAYEDKGVKVKAMLQMDMTAWVQKGTTESVGIIQDYVDPDLTTFLEQLVEKYLDIPSVKTQCGYACSDHASFGKAGYQSAFAIESTFENSNHHIHTTEDTINHPEFSFTHMREFSKLAVAFAVELGGKSE